MTEHLVYRNKDDKELMFFIGFVGLIRDLCPRGESGEMYCPRCGEKVNYSVARVNGHVSAACITEDCFSLIE